MINNPLFELKCIAKLGGQAVSEQIDGWIKRHIEQVGVSLHSSPAFKREDVGHLIESGMKKLGVAMAERANMYPQFEENSSGIMECRLTALCFVERDLCIQRHQRREAGGVNLWQNYG